MFHAGFLLVVQRLGAQVGRDRYLAFHVNAESPTLLASEAQIVSLRFRVLEMASVTQTTNSLRQGIEPADTWEPATRNLETRCPFSGCGEYPAGIRPDDIRMCIDAIKNGILTVDCLGIAFGVGRLAIIEPETRKTQIGRVY
jgi:hypothetical protein